MQSEKETFTASVPEREPCPECDGPMHLITGYRSEVRDAGIAQLPIAFYQCAHCGLMITVTVH